MVDDQPQLARGATPRTRCAAALALVVSFWLISGNWAMSRQFQTLEGVAFHKQEKEMEQRQFDTSGTSAAGFLLLGLAGAVAAVRRPLRPTAWTHPVVVACLAFAGWCALSILWSPAPALSLRKIAILALFLAGTLGLARQLTMRDLCWVAALSYAGFLGLGLLAELSLGTFHPGQSGYRFCGTFHPNDQGLHCALLILACVCLVWDGTRRWRLVNLMLAMGVVGLLFTKSRTAAAALGCTLLLALVLGARGKQRVLMVSALATLLCVAVGVFSFLPRGAIQSTESLASMGRSGNVESLTGRIPLWRELIEEVGARPWLGYSYGGYWDSRHIQRYSDMFEWQIPNAHNAYFDLVLSVGLVGLALYLCWIGGAWIVSVLNYLRSRSAVDFFATALVTFSIVHGFAESKFPFPGLSSALLFMAVFIVTSRVTAPVAARAPSRESTTRRDRPLVEWRLGAERL